MIGSTLRRVDVPPRRWDDYRALVPAELADAAFAAAAELRGARVLHVNATSYGGGVAELLSSEIGLLVDAGVDVQWRVICPDAELFAVTKRMHNALQGRSTRFTQADRDIWLSHNEHCAGMVGEGWDVVVVHDPQPAALAAFSLEAGTHWIWRCHIDTSTPDAGAWELLRPYVERHRTAVFTLDAFRPPDLVVDRFEAIAPAIDPLSTKNHELADQTAGDIVARAGVDPDRPLVVQVSRFDPWKDPLGVIEAWRIVRDEVPGTQLALIGAMADDDPEGWDVYATASDAAAGEPDCHLLTNQQGIGALEVNAFQRQADVAVQKSLREGFGLTVSEALWKRTPVVGGVAGGIPLQIGEDEGGALVKDTASCAEAVIALLRDDALRQAKGQAGRERVGRRFLMPRLAGDDLALYRAVVDEVPSRGMV